MRKTLLGVTALLAAALTGSAGAQAPEQSYVQLQRKETMAGEPTVGARQALLAAVATWISKEFDLPPVDRLPQVVLVSPDRITAMRYQRLLPGATAAKPTMAAERETVALYSDAAHTIYLPDGWNGDTPAGSLVLVQEVVHHFQNVLGIGYECPQTREKLAYLAQNRWLGRFGRSLEQDFDIDPLTLLVTTKCFR